jgi:hypothetical protein
LARSEVLVKTLKTRRHSFEQLSILPAFVYHPFGPFTISNMKLSYSLPAVLSLFVGYIFDPVVGGAYDSKLNSVDNHMVQLDDKISELQWVAQTNG